MTHFPTYDHYETLYCIKGEATTPLFAHKKIFYRLFLHTLFTFVYDLST
jgi:hypothetical protein